MMSKSVGCPICGHAATLTWYERMTAESGAGDHRIEFECADRSHTLTEPELLLLWAADRPRHVIRS